jgi:hypothetical protein
VLADALDPAATAAVVVRRLRERMDEHALAALFLLAALLDDPRVARAAELLARPGGGGRAVALEVLDVVLPATHAAGLLALIEGGRAGAARARRALGRAAPAHEAAVAALLADGDALTVRLLSRTGGGGAGCLDGGVPSVRYEVREDVTDDVDKILHLRGVDLFQQLTTQQLADLAAAVEEVTARDGEAVVTEGERADCMYFIVDGRVRGTRDRVVLFELGPHEFFGEMGVLDGGTRSATVTAMGPTRLLRLERDDILRLMDEQPAIAIAVCQTLSRRLRELLEDRARLERARG